MQRKAVSRIFGGSLGRSGLLGLGVVVAAQVLVGTGCSGDETSTPVGGTTQASSASGTGGSDGEGGRGGGETGSGSGTGGVGEGGSGGIGEGGTGGLGGGGTGGVGEGGTGGVGEGGGGNGGGGGSESGSGGAGGAGGEGGGAAELVKVQLLAFNDFHGNIEPPSGSNGKITLPGNMSVNAGGAAFFANHIASLRAANPNTVVVSAGDLIGASPLTSALFHDEPTIEAMNMIGLDINAVGNHEFDDGSSELLRMQYGGCSPKDGCTYGAFFAGASFQFLAANVIVDESTNKTLFPRYDIREFEGAKIAFIGMTLEATPTIVTPLGVAGLKFMDEVETVNAIVPELEAMGIEAIVVVVHEGGQPTGAFNDCPGISGPIVEIATNISPAVDIVLSGHTHQAYNCEISGKLVTSAASFGRLITDIDLEIDKATGDVATRTATNVVVTRDTADPVIDALVTDAKAQAAPLANKQLGTITADLLRAVPAGSAGMSVLGAVIADGQLAATAGPQVGGAQVAFMNPGGIRTDLLYAPSAGDASPGIVTYGEAFAVQPFGNSLVVMTLTGAQLKDLLEQQFYINGMGNAAANILQVSQGFTYSYSLSAPLGSKVDAASLAINGVPVDPAQTYRVTSNSFLASGGDGFTVFADGTARLGGVNDLDAFQAYFATHSPVSPPALDRVTVLP